MAAQDEINLLFNKTKNISSELGNIAKTGVKTGKVGALEYLPYAGDIYDIARGAYQATHGHPFVGTGQALLGAGGLAANLLAPGTGTLAKSGIKAGGKAIMKAGGKTLAKAAQTGAKMNKSLKYQIGTAVIPEVLYNTVGSDKSSSNSIANTTSTSENKTNKKSTSNNKAVDSLPPVPTIDMEGPMDDAGRMILGLTGGNQSYIDDNTQPINIGNVQQPNEQQQFENADNAFDQQVYLKYLNDRFDKQQELMKPYREGLQNLINNYDDYMRNAYNLDRYYTGFAGWSGNPAWANFGKRYNQVTNEATKLDLLNKLAQGQISDINSRDEIQGNLAMAEASGLDPRLILANPNMVKNMSGIINARESAEARRYVADQNLKAKIYDTYLDNAIKAQIANGNWKNAQILTDMKNQNRLQSALLTGAGFGADPNMLINLYNKLANNTIDEDEEDSEDEVQAASSAIENYLGK